MISKSETEDNFNECKYCNSTKIVFDPQSSEKICSTCGVVLVSHLEDSSPEFDFTTERLNSHNRMPSSLAHPDKGLSTEISVSNADANGMSLNPDQISKINRIRRWNRISSTNRSYHRNLKNAFAILIRIKEQLSFSDSVIEKSAYYYRKVLDLKIIKGRSIKEFIVACVYTACREMNIPRPIDEIVKVADADKVFAGKCYRLLLRKLRIRLPAIDFGSHIVRIANNANVSEKTVRRAIDMMWTMKDHSVSFGKDPSAISVAVLYGACLEQGEKISQVQVASAGNMSIVTLRKRFLDVRKVFPSLPSGPNDQIKPTPIHT